MRKRPQFLAAVVVGRLPSLLAAVLALGMAASAARAQAPTLQDLLSGIVQVKTVINPDARTTENLGRERSGSGIVIDQDGLVLTIGYLMLEAHAAEVITHDGRTLPANIVGYDHASGFGLLRTITPLQARPLMFGKSAEVKERDRVLAASFGGAGMIAPVNVVSRREFAGSWEYLLDDAIYTSPPHPAWSGAALVNREGRLVGVGSLIMADVSADGSGTPGNMFVPIDLLPPILADLLTDGRRAGAPSPWLGVNTVEVGGRLLVTRLTAGGPAEKAGMQRGDIVLGVGGKPATGLGDLYRKVWALGRAGIKVPLDVQRDGNERRIEVESMNRLDHLRLKSTY
jgi:S1-C subfamily serine protease